MKLYCWVFFCSVLLIVLYYVEKIAAAFSTHHRGVVSVLLGLHEPIENFATVARVNVDVTGEHVEPVLNGQILRAGKGGPINLIR